MEDLPTEEYWELYEAYYNTRFDEIYLELLEEYLSNNGIEDISEEENDAINARAHELTQPDAAARYNRADYPTVIEEHMEERETILWNPLAYGEFLN